MSRRITLELPDDVLDRAERLATLRQREVAEVVAEAVAAALPPMEALEEDVRPIAELPDGEVQRLASARLPPFQDRRLSELLDRQQAGTLTGGARAELLALMQLYEASLLRQAEALAEAVGRGLREPLTP